MPSSGACAAPCIAGTPEAHISNTRTRPERLTILMVRGGSRQAVIAPEQLIVDRDRGDADDALRVRDIGGRAQGLFDLRVAGGGLQLTAVYSDPPAGVEDLGLSS